MRTRHGWLCGGLVLLVGIILLGSTAYLTALALPGAYLVRLSLGASGAVVHAHDVRPWVIVALAASVAAIVGWAWATWRMLALRDGADARLAELQLSNEREAQANEREAQANEREAQANERAAQANERAAQAKEREAQAVAREQEARTREAQAKEREAQALTREQEARTREAQTREREEEVKAKLATSERRRRGVETEQRREREEVARVARAWRAQREWNRELREQIMRLQHAHGILGHHDPREMVLQLTVELVEAEKGMLLSRYETRDGRLAVACAVGFEHDPQDSAVAQRFAEAVIERGATIREDGVNTRDHGQTSPADAEVENLLAIPIYLHDDFDGVIVCANRAEGFESLDDDVLLAVGDHAGAVLQNSRLLGQLRNAYLATVRMLSAAIEVKDPDLPGPPPALSDCVLGVADRLGFEPRRREELLFGSLLHDIGKIGISERILLKPGPLTDEEWSVIRVHPRIGYHLVRQIPVLEPIAAAVLHHHERYDGGGYPGGLRGETIPIEARIITVADAFRAMTAARPFRDPRSVAEACAELERCAGEQFDPEVVRLFVREVRERPPEEFAPVPRAADGELELHREDGSFVLGGRSLGITDSLTQLYSHRHFHETAHAEAQRAIVQRRPFSVIVGVLVDLPEVNRSRGFGAGDSALQTVGDTFRRMAAGVDGLAFRVSGRRIGLIAPLDEAETQRLIAELNRELANGRIIALGAAVWRRGESGEQVIERALRLTDWQPAAVSQPTG